MSDSGSNSVTVFVTSRRHRQANSAQANQDEGIAIIDQDEAAMSEREGARVRVKVRVLSRRGG